MNDNTCWSVFKEAACFFAMFLGFCWIFASSTLLVATLIHVATK